MENSFESYLISVMFFVKMVIFKILLIQCFGYKTTESCRRKNLEIFSIFKYDLHSLIVF